MAYKITSGTEILIELWCKLDQYGWSGYRFYPIHEDSEFEWTYYKTYENGSQASLPSGYTHVASVDGNTAYVTRIDENGIKVHPVSTENNRVEIKAAGMQVYKGGYLKANYADTITLYGGSNASGANPSVSLSSTDFKMLDSGGVQRIALDATNGAIIGKPTKGHTQITDAGTYFYDTNNKKRSAVDADGLTVYGTDGTTSVAQFGSTVRVGKAAASRIEVESTCLNIYGNSSTGSGYGINFYQGAKKYGEIRAFSTESTFYDVTKSSTDPSATTRVAGGLIVGAETGKWTGIVSPNGGHWIGISDHGATWEVGRTHFRNQSQFREDLGLGGMAVLGVKNNVSVGALGWASVPADNIGITSNTLAYWNGAYSGTSSNLAYCNKGAFGALATHSSVSNTFSIKSASSESTTIKANAYNHFSVSISVPSGYHISGLLGVYTGEGASLVLCRIVSNSSANGNYTISVWNRTSSDKTTTATVYVMCMKDSIS